MNNLDNFIRALQRLLSALFLRDLVRRIANYRRSTSPTPEKELASALDRLIDNSLANASRSSSENVSGRRAPETAALSTSTKAPKPSKGVGDPADTAQEKSAVTKTHRMNNSLGQKMWASALEHIHAAHRYALKGDSANAQLHKSIAKEAIKDASRYLSDDEFDRFIAQIRQELQSLPE